MKLLGIKKHVIILTGLSGALVCVFVGFWDRDYVSLLPCVRNASPRGPMCFKYLIFNLSSYFFFKNLPFFCFA